MTSADYYFDSYAHYGKFNPFYLLPLTLLFYNVQESTRFDFLSVNFRENIPRGIGNAQRRSAHANVQRLNLSEQTSLPRKSRFGRRLWYGNSQSLLRQSGSFQSLWGMTSKKLNFDINFLF